MFAVSTQLNQENSSHKARNRFMSVVLCLVFLFLEVAGLAHSHEGDLERDLDCEICLNIGTSEDAIASSDQTFDPRTNNTAFLQYAEQISFGPAIPANSRAPPLV